MKLTTTYQLLKRHDACEDRYAHLQAALKEKGHKGTIPLSLILETNGFDDALWALDAVPKAQQATRDRCTRLFACDCAERVLPVFETRYPDDSRVRSSIECARLFAVGVATADELAAARDAAGAASVAAWAARDAASATRNASSAAARAARDAGAAWDARDARDAAWAARDAAWAASAAERSWQSGRLAWYLDGGEG